MFHIFASGLNYCEFVHHLEQKYHKNNPVFDTEDWIFFCIRGLCKSLCNTWHPSFDEWFLFLYLTYFFYLQDCFVGTVSTFTNCLHHLGLNLLFISTDVTLNSKPFTSFCLSWRKISVTQHVVPIDDHTVSHREEKKLHVGSIKCEKKQSDYPT